MSESKPNMEPAPSREEALFQAAAQLKGDGRASFLDGACGGDDALRRRLEALLAAHDAPDEPADGSKPKPALPATIKLKLPPMEDESVGKFVGNYKILEKVGEGGCGVVYVAEQTEPVRRRVALKVIKLGMDTKAVVARFEAERQALAMMDHPNIAKVLDAGATGNGRPYFVMELVRGIRITDYCDQAQLTTTERIDLFIKVCQAIQHAHQKGIIHRDIKPSNILVTLHDGVPVPKVIDFGIAKATEGRLTDATVYTELHQFIGTPAYMSPEQAEMSGLDIDTRSDVYSLGVLLYELLAGSTPFDSRALMAAGVDQMRRMIREQDPMRPSTRFATLQGNELTTTAKRRSVDTAKLIHQLKGDLDWIIMKCLEKDRRRRYETANGLAADLKRHLDNEAVLACPPSAAYRFKKAFRRNQVAFTAGLAVAAALLLGLIASVSQDIRARRAEALALRSRSDAEKLLDFMLDDFYTQLEPNGQVETLIALTRRAIAYYDSLPKSLRTPDTERGRALALARLAVIIARQTDKEAATANGREAVAILEPMWRGGDHSEATIFGLGLGWEAQGLVHYQIGEPSTITNLFQHAADVLRPAATSAEGSRRIKLEYANVLNNLGHYQPGEQAIATSEEALRILARLGALDLSDLTAASAWGDIADSEAWEALTMGRRDDAEALEKQGRKLAGGVLARRPGDLRARMDLYFSARLLGELETGREHIAEALKWARQSREAAGEYQRYNPADTRAWGFLILADNTIIGHLLRLGRFSEAVQTARATAPVDTQHSAGVSAPPARQWLLAAFLEAQLGHRADAEQALREGRESLEDYENVNHLSDLQAACWTEEMHLIECEIQSALGDDEAAYASATAAIARVEKLRPTKSERSIADAMVESRTTLVEEASEDAAVAALRLKRNQEAEAICRAEITTSARPEQGGFIESWAWALLAHALVEQDRKPEALSALTNAIPWYTEHRDKGNSDAAFLQQYARVFFLKALVQPSGSAGDGEGRKALAEAAKALQEVTDDVRQTRDTRELLAWIEAAQKKLPATNSP